MSRSTSLRWRRAHRCLNLSVAFGILLGVILALYSSSLTVKRSREWSSRRKPPRESLGIRDSRGAVNSLGLDSASSGVSTVPLVSTHQGGHLHSALVKNQPLLSSYPSPEVSTVLSLHVFKVSKSSGFNVLRVELLFCLTLALRWVLPLLAETALTMLLMA